MPAVTPNDPLYGYIIYSIGGWLIGGSLVLLLEGILIGQVSNYYSWYHEDPLRMKLGVAFLFVLTILKTMQSFSINWIQTIMYAQDPLGTIDIQRDWYFLVNIPLHVGIGLFVQAFYCYRLWKLSEHRWWVVAPIICVMILGLVAAMINTSILVRTIVSSDWFAVLTACSFVTDIMITLGSTYYLVIAKNAALGRTKKLISNIIRLSFQTAVPGTIATLIQLVAWRIGEKSVMPQPANTVMISSLHIIPIIYANSMLYILNTRRNLRFGDSSHANQSSHNPSRGRALTSRIHDEVELAALSGGIRVHTQIETTRSFETKGGPSDHRVDSKDSTII